MVRHPSARPDRGRSLASPEAPLSPSRCLTELPGTDLRRPLCGLGGALLCAGSSPLHLVVRLVGIGQLDARPGRAPEDRGAAGKVMADRLGLQSQPLPGLAVLLP